MIQLTGKKLLTVASNLLTGMLLSTLLLTAFLVVSSKIKGDETDLFGYQIKTVLSGSMEPDIPTGSIIFVKVAGTDTRYQQNDIITYRTADHIPVTHRIIQVENKGEQYVTKGDANDRADIHPVPSEAIIGKQTGMAVPYAGYVLNAASSPKGAAILLIVPGLFFIIRGFYMIWGVAQHIARTKNEMS